MARAMADISYPPQEGLSLEDAEVQRTQLFAAIQAARYTPSEILSHEDQLAMGSQLLRRGVSSRSSYASPSPQLGRTRSAVRGPVTDRRGLGTLAPYVLPGMLRRASMGIPFESLHLFPSQTLSDDLKSSSASGSGRQQASLSGPLHQTKRPRASTAPRQRPSGICLALLEKTLTLRS